MTIARTEMTAPPDHIAGADRVAALKIAIAVRDPIGTGGGSVALQTARALIELGHEVVVVSDYPVPDLPKVDVIAFGQALKRWQPGFKVTSRIRHLAQLLVFSALGRMKLRKYENAGYITVDHNLEAWGGDVVVIHNVFGHQYRADHRPLLRRLPQFFNPAFHFRILRERIILRLGRVQTAVAVSEQTLEEARPYLRDGMRTGVVHNGVDLDRFVALPPQARTARRIEQGINGNFVALFVGHEFERKRLDLVLEAIAASAPDVVLWVVGGRVSNQSHYEDMARKLGVLDRVRFWGTRPDVEAFFQVADAFVLPSEYETWALVCLEAMAAGVPVIMSAVGCAPHVIEQGRNGYVVKPAVAEIAAALARMNADRMHHEAMRSAARTVAQAYSWSGVARQYLRLIQDAAPSRAP
ncbi:MAG: glycosyltransferase family 4 protein [Pseudomonadota bacterium]|nr:glycosyltransferase family 4 protein [Pseudomonadota bacterium]